MEQQNYPRPQSRRFYMEPLTAYRSKDGEYLTLVLPGNLVIRKHVNYLKALLDIPFSPKPRVSREDKDRV